MSTPTPTCTAAETACLTHSFKVVGGFLHRDLGAGRYVRSAAFAVGGHRWCIRYYPGGSGEEYCKDYAAIFLELMSKSKHAEATAHYDFRLVNQVTGVSSSLFTSKALFNDKRPALGIREFVKKSDLEALGYLKDDCLEIECDVTVITGDVIEVPPSDLAEDLGKLMESEEGVDVTFKVKEVVFKAHRIVLAMRSPVFKAELYGATREDDDGNRCIVVVDDMEPAVFKALLHFIYTDCLPNMDDDIDGSEYEEMAKHLLVAAHRYGVAKMKLMSESILCKRLSVKEVANTLVLADQYHCSKLKDACVQFIESADRMDDVAASQGYENLKRTCPALIVKLWEKSAMSRKI
jgi:speckle-type POZ protein